MSISVQANININRLSAPKMPVYISFKRQFAGYLTFIFVIFMLFAYFPWCSSYENIILIFIWRCFFSHCIDRYSLCTFVNHFLYLLILCHRESKSLICFSSANPKFLVFPKLNNTFKTRIKIHGQRTLKRKQPRGVLTWPLTLSN